MHRIFTAIIYSFVIDKAKQKSERYTSTHSLARRADQSETIAADFGFLKIFRLTIIDIQWTFLLVFVFSVFGDCDAYSQFQQINDNNTQCGDRIRELHMNSRRNRAPPHTCTSHITVQRYHNAEAVPMNACVYRQDGRNSGRNSGNACVLLV